jgi:signal transduction histidine kinase/CheY-like chemotaxis protein
VNFEEYYWNSSNRLWTFVALFDSDLRLLRCNERMARCIPGFRAGDGLLEHFVTHRPRNISTAHDLKSKAGTLFLLVSRDEDYAMRGQFIEDMGSGKLWFFGAPWLSWLSSSPKIDTVELGDFLPSDPQLDQMIQLSAMEQMVDNLEALNQQLTDAKIELETVQRVRNNFFSQMSHEMRTPLNGIVSALSLLSEKPLSAGENELLDMARTSSRQLLQVVNYVLEIARLESDDAELELGVINLSDTIHESINVVRSGAVEKGLPVEAHIDPALQSHYLGDQRRIRQVLLNLLTNAVKFTQRGGITVRATIAAGTEQTLHIQVKDTGIGISDERQADIWQPFVTEDPDAPGVGTGLGLDIARRHTELMGGQIGVDSAPGQGSTFWFTLPLQACEKAEPAMATIVEPTNTGRFDGCVLLVDDNETNLKLTSMLLDTLGVRCVTANSGKDAIAAVAEHQPDLVLMDINMPIMDGYEAAQRTNALTGGSIPIVALSAYTGESEVRKARAAGMSDFLFKPVEREALAGILGQWLNEPREEPVSSAPAEATFHNAALNELQQQIGPDNLALVIEQFQQEARSRWDKVLSDGSTQWRAREAHTLASTCRSFGLGSLADRFKEMEQRAEQGTTEDELELQETERQLAEGLAQLSRYLEGINRAA